MEKFLWTNLQCCKLCEQFLSHIQRKKLHEVPWGKLNMPGEPTAWFQKQLYWRDPLILPHAHKYRNQYLQTKVFLLTKWKEQQIKKMEKFTFHSFSDKSGHCTLLGCELANIPCSVLTFLLNWFLCGNTTKFTGIIFLDSIRQVQENEMQTWLSTNKKCSGQWHLPLHTACLKWCITHQGHWPN